METACQDTYLFLRMIVGFDIGSFRKGSLERLPDDRQAKEVTLTNTLYRD